MLVAITLLAAAASAHVQESRPTFDRRREDLAALYEELQRRHVNLFHRTSREDYDKAVRSLDARLPSLTEAQVVTEFARIVALAGDGHTSLDADGQDVVPFRWSPIELYDFDDGLYVVAAPEAYAAAVGRRLVRVGALPVADALRVAGSIVSCDNAMELRYTTPVVLTRPEALRALGVIDDADAVPMTFDDPASAPVRVRSVRAEDYSSGVWRRVRTLPGDPRGLSQNVLFATPFTVEHVVRREHYWFARVPGTNAVCFRYDTCWDEKGRPTFAETTRELFRFMAEVGAERLLVDLRQNPGGEPATAKPLIDALAANPALAGRDGLYVLVGRRTFSAALTNAARLRRDARAVIVGEPPRGKPNHPSEGRDFRLPFSKMLVSVSTERVVRDPDLADASTIPVDVSVPVLFSDYRAGVDAALDAALKHRRAAK